MIRTSDGTSFKRVGGKPGDRAPLLGISRPRALYTATGGETSVTLSSLSPAISYTPGQNQLTVRRSSGGTLIAGLDFFESTVGSISFPTNDPLVAGEVVEIIKEYNVTSVMATQARPDIYTATATAGQTLVTSVFSWPYNFNSAYSQGAVRVYLHGLLQARGVDYTEVNLGTANTNQITFVDALIGGENIVIIPMYQVLDQTAATSSFLATQSAAIQSTISAGTQGFIDQSSLVSVPATTIIGRAKIPDLTNDLRASFGIDRIQFLDITQLQTEFGSNGENVYALVNDDRGLVRLVGTWTAYLNSNGSFVNATSLVDYIEVTFYGTALNLLVTVASPNQDIRVTIDGGTEGANIYPALTTNSNVIGTRNYNSNTVLSCASGLTLGVHTAKIRMNGAVSSANICGVEIINAGSASTLNVNPGSAYIAGQKYQALLAQSLAYNSGVTGTRGGRQVIYLKADGTIGQAFQAVNSSSAIGFSADHTNEEPLPARTFREFGAGRTDDFATLAVTARGAGFTLNDGTTTLVGSNCSVNAASGPEGLVVSTNSNSITYTFVGTGLDLQLFDTGAGGADTWTYQIDGGTTNAWPYSAGSLTVRTQKLVSGLPYGTHTLKINRVSAATWGPSIVRFIAYQPKKPTIPSGAIELADYNVMATYVANTVAGLGTIATGVLRKVAVREFSYQGTWGVGGPDYTNLMNGTDVSSSSAGATMEYPFFGTGGELRFACNTDRGTNGNITILIDGVLLSTSNFTITHNGGAATGTGPAVTTSTYGSTTFTPGTGVLNQNFAFSGGNGLTISGLTVGAHKLKVLSSSASTFAHVETFDVITPIHSVKSNLYSDQGNTLPVGSLGLADTRKTSMIKEILPAQKANAQATGVFNSPTTSSTTFVPLTDLSLTVKTGAGLLDIAWSLNHYNSGVNTNSFQLYMDGVAIGTSRSHGLTVAGTDQVTGDSLQIQVAAGTHKIDLFWKTSAGTATADTFSRTLKVREN